MSTWRFAHVLMTMAFGAGLSGCFNPPGEAVLFACDAETAPTCPAGYSCEADDCCHRDGSDLEAELGSCRIGGGMSATDPATGPASTTTTDTNNTATASTTSTATDSTASSGSVTTSTASSGAGTSGSSGGDTGSSDAGTTT
jgi:hypothetical protein